VLTVFGRRRALIIDRTEQLSELVPPVRPGGPSSRRVVVVLEPSRTRVTRELLGQAAVVAAAVDGSVVAFGPAPGDPERLAAWGADEVVALSGTDAEEDIARALTEWCTSHHAWAVFGTGTAWGREVLGRAAAALEAGLTGDAVELEARDGTLVAWKPAFGGKLLAEILTSSAVSLATVRAGVLPLRTPREVSAIPVEQLSVESRSRVRVVGRERDDDSDELASAPFVIGIGVGVSPDDYAELRGYCDDLDAVLCATRKVTDKGWMPRARQVGITGHSITPQLFISLGASGKFNHTVGVRAAGTVLAVNTDPKAPVFDYADIGIVGDWREVMAALTPRLVAARKG
jgi:electron transfer flavoprotein alpha subunit